MARGYPAPALRLWLAHVRPALPPRRQRSEGSSPRPRGSGSPASRPVGHPHGMLTPLDGHGCEPQLGSFDPAVRPPGPGSVGPRAPRGPWLAVWPGGRTLAVPPASIGGRTRSAPKSPPCFSDRGPLPARGAGAAAPRPWTNAPQRRVLLVEGWDDEAEGSGGPWLGITHGDTIRCLLRGDRPLAPPRPAHGRRGSASLHPAGVRRVVYSDASPGGAPATSAAPALPRGGRRPRSGVACSPRARGGVAAAPRGAGPVPRALTQVCGHWEALPLRPSWPSPLPPLAPPPPPPPRRARVHSGRGHRPSPRGGGYTAPP